MRPGRGRALFHYPKMPLAVRSMPNRISGMPTMAPMSVRLTNTPHDYNGNAGHGCQQPSGLFARWPPPVSKGAQAAGTSTGSGCELGHCLILRAPQVWWDTGRVSSGPAHDPRGWQTGQTNELLDPVRSLTMTDPQRGQACLPGSRRSAHPRRSRRAARAGRSRTRRRPCAGSAQARRGCPSRAPRSRRSSAIQPCATGEGRPGKGCRGCKSCRCRPCGPGPSAGS